MKKTLVVAGREYRAAVRSKAFIITLVLMPVFMVGSLAIQVLFKKMDDRKERKIAVIDRSPGGVVGTALKLSADAYNASPLVVDPKTKEQQSPKFVVEILTPDADLPKQRFDLSQRVENDGLDAVMEIGPHVLDAPDGRSADDDDIDDDHAVRFQAKNLVQNRFRIWAEQTVNAAVIAQRLARAGVDLSKFAAASGTVPFKTKALTVLNKQTGTYEDKRQEQQIANFFLPVVLIGLMFTAIMVGATPAMQGIVEEKSQRIAEVLLGSLSPFELMAGKLIGVIGVSLTLAGVYLVGGLFVADRFGVASILSPALILYFLFNLVLALLIFGSLFVAVGAAAGDIKDTQTLLMPIMIVACLPFFALGPIMEDPNGKIATWCTFFPFASPMLLTRARRCRRACRRGRSRCRSRWCW